MFFSPGGNVERQTKGVVGWRETSGRCTVEADYSCVVQLASVCKGFLSRHLDLFAHLCYPPGLCRHFAVIHDQNPLCGLIAQRLADTFSSKKLWQVTTKLLLFFLRTHMRQGQCLKSRSSNLGRERIFIRLSSNQNLKRKKKIKKHQFVDSLLEEHKVLAP